MGNYQKEIMTVIARCTSDVRNIAEDGPWTLEAQVRAYDLLDMLLGGGYMPKELLTAEDTEEFVRVYADFAQKVDAAFDPDDLKRQAEESLESYERACSDARFEAAAAAGLHEFAKEMFQVWQDSGVFARRRALKALRERAGFNLESHRIGNYVAKTFDLMNEAEARFARAQQAMFLNDSRYKCAKNPYREIYEYLIK